MCSRLVRVKKKKSLSLNETLMFLKCLKRQTVLADALMRVWWESRHPLPQTNTTECSGNCWLTVPSRNHAAARNHHLPTRRCLLHQLTLIVTPTHADSAVIISKLQYSSCSSLLFKKNKQTPPAYAVSPFRPPRCICTYRRQPEIEVDVVLIRKRPASLLICTNCPHIGCCYYCCCCTGSEKKAGRQAQSYCTET